MDKKEILKKSWVRMDLASPKYPSINSGNEIAEVVQSHFGITDSKDKKPIIATSDFFSCVGLLGYDREHGIGFLMHIEPCNDVHGGLQRLYQELAQKYPIFEKEFDTYILASCFYDLQTLTDLEEALKRDPSNLETKLNFVCPMHLFDDMKIDGKKSVALNTRNGTILTYLIGADSTIGIKEAPHNSRYNVPLPENERFR
jgi:hypothetical protein